MTKSFDILNISGQAYKLVWQNVNYFTRLAVIPLLIHLACSLVLFMMKTDITPIRGFLIHLPAHIVTAWFLCVGVRFIIFNEHIGDPPHAGQDRSYSVKLSILLTVLFNMGMSAVGGLIGQMSKTLTPDQPGLTFFFLVLGAALLWAVRYGTLYIPAAVGYPIKLFLNQIGGFGYSFRILGLFFVVSLPPTALFLIFAKLFFKDALVQDQVLPLSQAFPAFLMNSVFSFILITVVNAGVTLAIQTMMRGDTKAPRRL